LVRVVARLGRWHVIATLSDKLDIIAYNFASTCRCTQVRKIKSRRVEYAYRGLAGEVSVHIQLVACVINTTIVEDEEKQVSSKALAGPHA
jgi:hypothetical protein